MWNSAILSALAVLIGDYASTVVADVTTNNTSNASTCTGYKLKSANSESTTCVWLNHGEINYNVLLGSRPALSPSRLGLVRDDVDLATNFSSLVCDAGSSMVQKYEVLQGKARRVESHYRRHECIASTPAGHQLIVEWATSKHNIAFRYTMPEDANITARTILHERSTFAITKSSGDYQIAQPYDGPTPKYQTFYQPRNNRTRIAIGEANGSTGFAFAALFRTTDSWISIKEAGFDGTYPASHLSNISHDGIVSLGFPSVEDGNGAFGPGTPRSPLPWTTPWRIITLSSSIADVIADTSVTDLAEPSKIAETSWIRPGAVSWSWWANSSYTTNYTATKAYIDLASRLGWPYSVLDSAWDQQKDDVGNDVPLADVVAYAASKSVKLWLWVNSAGPNNNATENTPRDLLYERSSRRKSMARFAGLGVAGLKVDGIQSEKQQMMAYLLDILRDAAEFKLMVVFHNCPLPHGWERTWPNLLSSEGLIASEYYTNANKAYSAQMPENNVNEAFVRYPIGPADYSPGVFSVGSHPTDETHTTWAHEVALNVIVDSGLHIFPDTPFAYETLLPKSITRLLGSLPFVWDTTTFLQGEPGKQFVIAKRSRCDIYIAGINGATVEIDSNAAVNRAVGEPYNLTVDLGMFDLRIGQADVLTISDVAGSREAHVDQSRLGSHILRATLEPFGGILWKISSPDVHKNGCV